MKRMITWLETSFAPRMNRVNSNPWIVSLKDSILQTLPFIFVGSVFAMLALLNDYFPGLPSFWTPFGWTMGMIGLFVSFLLPFNLMEKLKLRKQRFIAGMSGIVLFLIVITPQVIESGEPGFNHSALGAGGMFVAIVTGLFTAFVMRMFGRFTFFKEDSAIPDFVRGWFDSMLPIAVIVVAGWLLIQVANFDLFNLIQNIFSPLATILENPFGWALVMFVYCFIYSMGISVWVLTPVFVPVYYQAMADNMAGTAENLVTYPTIFTTYLWIGGTGATLSLVIMMAFMARAVRLKALGRASLVPGILNINEPVIFGAIAWNPTLMIPLWLQGLILPLVIWFFTKVIPFAPIPNWEFDLWYTPFPVSTWIATQSFTAVLLAVIVFAVSAVIWFPFFRAYDDQLVKTEAAEAAKAAEVASSTGDGTIRRPKKKIAESPSADGGVATHG